MLIYQTKIYNYREAIGPLIQTWDAFWVRNVDLYYGEAVGESVNKVQFGYGDKSRPYLVYRRSHTKRYKFKESVHVKPAQQTDEVLSGFKNSFVCERDLD